MRADRGLGLALRYLAALVALVVFLFPIYWLFAISFKTPDEIFASPPVWWPAALQLANYAVLFKDGDAWTVFNSLVIAGVSTVLAMLLGTLVRLLDRALPHRRRQLRHVGPQQPHAAADRHRVPGVPALRQAGLGRHLSAA